MKRIAKIFILIFLSLSLTSCIVQSLHPFYKDDALIELPQVKGEWILIKEAGKDVSKKRIRPWVFSSDRVQTFDEKGIGSILKVKYFRVEDTIFADIMPGEPDRTRLNEWWFFHVAPVHSVARVTIKDDSLIIHPMNYDWIGDALKAGRVSLPYIRLEKENMIVFNTDSDTWMAFLKKYKDDKELFPERLEYVFKRHQPDNKGDSMKESKSGPDDFSIEYRWREGSVPPPDHYEYTIHLGPGTKGRVVFSPDYPEHHPPVWTESFNIEKGSMEMLYRLMEGKGIFTKRWTETDEALGGPLESVKIRADGRDFMVPGGIREREDVEEVYGLIRSSVPEETWNLLMSKRERFVEVKAKAKVVAIEGVSYNVNSSMSDNLKALIGKKVYITLGSGKTLAGLVKEVGDHLIHLEKLEGKEFFDALIRIEDIEDIDTRFRNLQR